MNERKSFTVCRVGDDRRAVDRVVDRWQVTGKDGKPNKRDMACYEKKSIGLRESNFIVDERREVSDSVNVVNGFDTVLLMTMQKRSSSWSLVDR